MSFYFKINRVLHSIFFIKNVKIYLSYFSIFKFYNNPMFKKRLLFCILIFFSYISFSQIMENTNLDSNLTDFEINFHDSIILINKYNELIFNSRKEYNYGIEHFNNNNLDDAIKCFSNAILIDSTFSMAYFYRAKCYDILNNSLSIIDYNKAFRYDSTDFSPLYAIASIKSSSDIQEAINIYNFIVSSNKYESKAYYELGVLFYTQMYYHKAINAFTSSINIKQDARVYNDRASCYRMLANIDLAIKDYTTAATLDSTLAFISNNLGSIYKNMDNVDSALYYYNLAIYNDSNYIHAINNRGGLYIDLNYFEKAIIDINKVLSIDNKYAPAYNNKAVIYYKKQEYNQALNFFDIAISLDSSYAKAFLNRGIVKQVLRNDEGACKDWNKASQLGIHLAKKYFLNDCK